MVGLSETQPQDRFEKHRDALDGRLADQREDIGLEAARDEPG